MMPSPHASPPAPRPVWRTCLLVLLGLLAACGVFQRTVGLTTTVKADAINASLENGALRLEIPKTEEVKLGKIAVNTNKQTVPVQTGLTTDCESIYFRSLLVAKNCWLDLIDEHYLFVVAGSNADNPVEGKVGFYTVLPDGSFLSEFTDYTTPSQHGAVTITAVALPRFTLTAEDGTTFVFNVETRAWE